MWPPTFLNPSPSTRMKEELAPKSPFFYGCNRAIFLSGQPAGERRQVSSRALTISQLTSFFVNAYDQTFFVDLIGTPAAKRLRQVRQQLRMTNATVKGA